MKTAFRETFERDLKKVKQKKLIVRVHELIKEVEAAKTIAEIRNVKKMAGAEHAYRFRVGELRIGIYLDKDTVEFVRCLDRKDMYKHFP